VSDEYAMTATQHWRVPVRLRSVAGVAFAWSVHIACAQAAPSSAEGANSVAPSEVAADTALVIPSSDRGEVTDTGSTVEEVTLPVHADGTSVDGTSVDGTSVDGTSVDATSVDGTTVDERSQDGTSAEVASEADASEGETPADDVSVDEAAAEAPPTEASSAETRSTEAPSKAAPPTDAPVAEPPAVEAQDAAAPTDPQEPDPAAAGDAAPEAAPASTPGSANAAVPEPVPPTVTQSTAVLRVEALRDGEGMLERRLVPPDRLAAGDELRYTIRLRNEGPERIAAGRVQVQTPVPAAARFLPGSAGGAGALVEYANDGQSFSPHVPEESREPAMPDANAAASRAYASAGNEELATPVPESESGEADPADESAEPPAPLTIRWTYLQPLEPGAVAEVYFHVRLL
jgi:uncharacterized repeat protein (TIGR01451 family)